MPPALVEIPTPALIQSGPFNGQVGCYEPGDGSLYLAVRSSSALGLLSSSDNGATWNTDGFAGDYPLSAYGNALGIIYNPNNSRMAAYRLLSGTLRWTERTGPGVWGSEQQTTASSDTTISRCSASFDSAGNIHGAAYSTSAGLRHLYYLRSSGSEETIALEGGPYMTNAITFVDLVIDTNDAPHVIFGGSSASGRSDLDTWWYTNRTSGSWSTPVAIKTDLVKAHGINDAIRMQIDNLNNIYVGFIALDAADAERIYFAERNPNTGVWSDTQVSSEFDTDNTSFVMTSRDRAGNNFLLAIGQIDSILNNVNQPYIFTRLSGESAWTAERVGSNAFDAASTGTDDVSNGSDFGAIATNNQPGSGGFWYLKSNLDSGSTIKYWSITSSTLDLGEPDEDNGGSSTAVGGSLMCDTRSLKAMREQIARFIQNSSTKKKTSIDEMVNEAYCLYASEHLWRELTREKEEAITATGAVKFLYLPKDCGTRYFIWNKSAGGQLKGEEIEKLFDRAGNTFDASGSVIEFGDAGSVGRKVDFHTAAETIKVVSDAGSTDQGIVVMVKGLDSTLENVLQEQLTLDSSGEATTTTSFGEVDTVSTNSDQSGILTYSGVTSLKTYGTIGPDDYTASYKRLRLYFTPTADTTLTMYYKKSVSRMVFDQDVPELPISNAIVAWAQSQLLLQDARLEESDRKNAVAERHIAAALKQSVHLDVARRSQPRRDPNRVRSIRTGYYGG